MKKYLYLSLYCVFLLGLSYQTRAQIITTIAGNGSIIYGVDGVPAITAGINYPTHTAMDVAGNLYFGNYLQYRICKIDASGIITTIGGTGTLGYTGDGGQATAAKISGPAGIAFDPLGNLYFSDYNNNRIRRISTSGIITTFAGTGLPGFNGDGIQATAAQINTPWGIASDSIGNIYFSDRYNSRIRKIDTSGVITTVGGTGTLGYTNDGFPATTAEINDPVDVSVDRFGNIIFSCFLDNRVRKIDSIGIIKTIAGTGVAGFNFDGISATTSKISNPIGVSSDVAGNVYIGDYGNNRVRKVDISGIISTIAGNGTPAFSGDGFAATAAQLNGPYGVAVYGSGNIYICDAQNHRIRKIIPNRPPRFTGGISQSIIVDENYIGYPINGALAAIDSDNGQLETWSVVTAPVHGSIVAAYSTTSTGLVVTPLALSYTPTTGYIGNDSFKVQVTDADGASDTIIIYVAIIPTTTAPLTISTIAGTGLSGYSGDGGAATAAKLFQPHGVALDASGNIYFADDGNNVIRKINTSGVISTVAGTGVGSYSGDGLIATGAALHAPFTVALDRAGNIYIGDALNNRVRKIDAVSGIITTIAGTGAPGYNGDNIAASTAKLNVPCGVAIDTFGNIYICDNSNQRVRKIDPTGMITTIAGNGSIGYSGDGGPSTGSVLHNPNYVHTDLAGNVYVTDNANHAIRKIDLSGNITTIAGTGVGGYNGDGIIATTAQIWFPGGTNVDAAGNVYIADYSNSRLRKIDLSGVINTIAGTASAGYSGDGCAASAAKLNMVVDVAIDARGNFIVADYDNNRIRKISPDHAPLFAYGHSQSIYVEENYVAYPVNLVLSVIDSDNGGTQTWSAVMLPVNGTLAASYTTPYTNGILAPVGLTYTPTTGYVGTDSFKVQVTDCMGESDTVMVHVTVVAPSSTLPLIITTIAGNGTAGNLGDGSQATAAEMNTPGGLYVDNSGYIYISEYLGNTVRKISPSGIITTIAGTGVAGYNGDNQPATAAQLNGPGYVTGDAFGNIYISENLNSRIRKVDASGVITTIAGTGSIGYTGDGSPATGATFHSPYGLSCDASGNLYIADQLNNAVRKITAGTGIITTVAGTGAPGYGGDSGPATTALIHAPNYVLADAYGNVYITDNNNHCIRKVNASGIITTIAGTGVGGYNGDGIAATAAKLEFPAGLRMDIFGNLYVADAFNERVRKINPSGIITTIAGIGLPAGYGGDGCAATAASFNEDLDVVFDANGNILVADAQNNRIRKLAPDHAPFFTGGHSQSITVTENYVAFPVNGVLTAIDSDRGGLETWSVISGPTHGTMQLSYTGPTYTGTSLGISFTPIGISYSPTAGYTGNDSFKMQVMDCVGVADTTTIYVNVVPQLPALPLIITTIAGTGAPGYTGDTGPATAATLWNTAGVVYDASGNAYVSDYKNNVVRKISATGIITTFAGTGLAGSGGDNGPATSAQLNAPVGLAIDASGDLYITSYNANKVRKVSPSGIITTFAGNGLGGYSADNIQATASELFHPSGLAIDDSGNVFIADYSNFRIRKVNTSGIITTVAGTGGPGNLGDGGPATNAQLHGAYGIAIDGLGNLYIGDAGNNRVRKISVSGIITNFAGTGTPGFTGDGTAAVTAELNNPPGVVADHFGDIYIADQFNNSIRKVDASGIITTIAGSGSAITGYSGDGCIATAAQLNLTNALTIDPSGKVVFCDNDNNVVRKLIPDHAPFFINGHNQSNITCEDAVDSLNSILAVIDSDRGSTETWVPASVPAHGTAGTYAVNITSPDSMFSPHNIYYIPAPGYSGADSFMIQVTDCAGVSDTTMIHITVKPLPDTGVITGNTAICGIGSTTTLADTATGGVWSSSATSIATVGNTGIVTSIAIGISTISYAVTNSCGTLAATAQVMVKPEPVITATATPTALCADDTLTLNSTPSGGSGNYTAFNWYGPGGFSAATQNTTNAGIPVAGAGVYTVTVTDSNGCVSAKALTVSVVVHPLPVVTPVANPSPVCVTTTLTLNATPTGGSGTYTSFTWSGPAAFTATTQNTSIVNIGFGAAGVYSVTVTDNNGCTAAAPGTTDSLIVNPLPPAITGDTIVCVGSITTLSDDPGGTWSSSNISFATVDVSSGDVLGVTSIGVPTITYTSVLGCIATTRVTVNQTPPAISGLLNVCFGLVTTLSDIPATGTWSTTDATIASIIPGGPGIGIVTGVSTGSSIITYTLPDGCMATGTMIVNPLPQLILGTTNACLGMPMALTDPDAGGVWSSSNLTKAIVDPGSGTVTGISAGTATITYTLPTGCITTTPVVFQVAPSPVTGTMSVCAGAAVILHDFPGGGTWASSDISLATVSTGAAGAGIVTGISAGFPTITYTLGTGCSSVSALTVNPLPAAPAAITGTSTLCAGSGAVFNDVTPGGTWFSSNGAVASVLSSGIVVGLSGGTTVISYTETNGCGSLAAILPLTINPLPATPAPITGAATVCDESVILLGDITSGGVWSTTDSAVATVNALGFVSGASGGVVTISYTKTNFCGSTVVTKTLTVNPLPPISAITGVTLLCAGTTTSLSDLVSGGTWVSSSLATATVSPSGLVTGIAGGTSTITYTTTNSCGVGEVVTVVTVNPLPLVPGPITGVATLCTGGNTTLVEVTAGGVWSSSDTSIAVVDSIGLVNGISIGNAALTYTETTACGTAHAYRTVTVNTVPVAAGISGFPVVCAGATTHLADLTAGGVWSSDNAIVAIIGDTGLVKGINQGAATISYIVTNNCGSASAAVVVSVNSLPVAGLVTGNSRVCPGDTVILSDNVNGGIWSSSNTSLAHVSGLGVVTGAAAGLDTIIYSVTNSCGTATATQLVSVLPLNVCYAKASLVTNNGPDELKVYPNPNNGSFTVLLSSENDEQIQLVVTNIIGQKVSEFTAVTNKPFDITLSSASGVYFISAITEHGAYVAKVQVLAK